MHAMFFLSGHWISSRSQLISFATLLPNYASNMLCEASLSSPNGHAISAPGPLLQSSLEALCFLRHHIMRTAITLGKTAKGVGG